MSISELGGRVVLPRGLHPHVLAEGGQRAVPGLVRDRAIGRPAQVREGDEPGPQRVRGERAALQPGPRDRGLDQVVDQLGVQGAAQGSVTPADLAEHRVHYPG
jgi:hypothetical protein